MGQELMKILVKQDCCHTVQIKTIPIKAKSKAKKLTHYNLDFNPLNYYIDHQSTSHIL